MKVDKDRQMVVLEEEFQVRGCVDGTSKKCRAGLGDPRVWHWRSNPSSDVILGKRLYVFLLPHL